MFNFITIARPYAEAAFEFSFQNKNILYWERMLLLTTKIIQNKEIKKFFLKNIEEKFFLKIIFNIFDKNIDNYFYNFLKLIVKNKRLKILPYISKHFIYLRMKKENFLEIKIISAKIISKKQLIKIIDILEKRLSCKLKFNCKIDKSIISGFIIKTNNIVIDNSLRSSLNKLKNFLQILKK